MSDNPTSAQVAALLNEAHAERDAAIAAREAAEVKLSQARADLNGAVSARDAAVAARQAAETQLADAKAQIGRLANQLATAQAATSAAKAEADAGRTAAAAAAAAQARALANLQAELTAATSQARADLDAAKAKIAQLEETVGLATADPPADSGVTRVSYFSADGKTLLKTRYRSSDGGKFKVLPDAVRRQAVVDLMAELGFTERQAEALVAKSDKVSKALGTVS